MMEITLLVLVALSALRPFGEQADKWFIALADVPQAALLVLLILMNLLLLAIYLQPEADLLWWLNLVGLTSLTAGVLSGFTPGHVLVGLSIIFCLAFRRLQGLRHIWHWRGMLVVLLGVAVGLGGATYGLGWKGMDSLMHQAAQMM